MQCSCCGNRIKSGIMLCPKCGKKVDREKMETAYPKVIDKRKRRIYLGIAAASIMILLFSVICVRSGSLTNKKIIDLVKNSGLTYRTIDGEEIFYTPTKIDILSKQKQGKKSYVVSSAIQMTSNDYIAELEYELAIGKQNGKWILFNYEQLQVRDIWPLKGIENLSDQEITDSIRRAYPDIDWNYEYNSMLGKNFNYNFPISYSLVERETDLNKKIDVFLYDYSFNTFTGHESGRVKIEYDFTMDGNWEQTEANIINSEFDWKLEGIWDFDIYTYYVNIEIMEMNFDSHVATMCRKGSVWQGYGDPEIIEVVFSEQDGFIYFDTFYILKDEWSGSQEEITLIAKRDDLYYKCPSMFSGADPYDRGIGGKTY